MKKILMKANEVSKVKTYKREMALLLFIWLVYVVETKDVQTITLLVWPVTTFISLAFGLDAYGKLQQPKPSEASDGGRPQRRS